MANNWYDRSPMWPQFNHGCPHPVPPDAEPYNTPYAVLGYTEDGDPVFTVHTVDGETYEVDAGSNIIVLKDTTYELSVSEDGTQLILTGSDGKTSTATQAIGIARIRGAAEEGWTSSGDYEITKDKLGLSHVENKNTEEILDSLTAERIKAKLGYTPADATDVQPCKVTCTMGFLETAEVNNTIRRGTLYADLGITETSGVMDKGVSVSFLPAYGATEELELSYYFDDGSVWYEIHNYGNANIDVYVTITVYSLDTFTDNR